MKTITITAEVAEKIRTWFNTQLDARHNARLDMTDDYSVTDITLRDMQFSVEDGVYNEDLGDFTYAISEKNTLSLLVFLNVIGVDPKSYKLHNYENISLIMNWVSNIGKPLVITVCYKNPAFENYLLNAIENTNIVIEEA